MENWNLRNSAYSSSSESSSEDESWDEGYKHLCDNFKNLKPYDFEPLASSTDTESDHDKNNTATELNEDSPRKGNKIWCLCDNCQIMTTERECWCCQEANEISDELFEGMLLFYANCLCFLAIVVFKKYILVQK